MGKTYKFNKNGQGDYKGFRKFKKSLKQKEKKYQEYQGAYIVENNLDINDNL